MKSAVIISRFEGLKHERFCEDFIYQLLVAKHAIKDSHVDIIPNSVDIMYEQSFNRLDELENDLAEKAVTEIKTNADHLLICIDRGITESMTEIVRKACLLNPKIKLTAYTLMPKGTIVRKIVDTINEEEVDNEEIRFDIMINVCKKLATKNRMVYSTAGDLTNYRLDFKQEIIDTEKSALLAFAATLENKIKRDLVNAKQKMAQNPFEILENMRIAARADINQRKQ